MKRIVSVLLIAVLFFTFLPASAIMDSNSSKKGHEDLSKLTYKELQGLLSDIQDEEQANHTPTDAQKKVVLSKTEAETEQ